jgi:hypothetical protein
MTTHNIKIIYGGKFEKHHHQVRPGYSYVSDGDKVIFSTKDTDIELFFPTQTKDLLDAPTNAIKISASGPPVTFTINKSKEGKFPYAVYCEAGNDFAEGGSAPAMIVE